MATAKNSTVKKKILMFMTKPNNIPTLEQSSKQNMTLGDNSD
jgi:hypothetical protein